MKTKLLLGLLLAAGAPGAVAETAHGTPAQARAMLEKAVAYHKENGRDAALKAFNDKRAPFADRDLYVFCIGPDNRLAADGQFHQFLGQPAAKLQDSKGRPLDKALRAAARKTPMGEVHYQWLNPVTNLIEPKVAFAARAGDDVCGVGAYDTQ